MLPLRGSNTSSTTQRLSVDLITNKNFETPGALTSSMPQYSPSALHRLATSRLQRAAINSVVNHSSCEY
eukprot:11223538-Ditylum_brightwellii.AAC.1